MALARQVALGGVRRPVVILISDLDDDPGDVPRLASVLNQYRRNALPVRIVALSPTPADQELFTRLLGPSVPVAQGALPNGAPAVHTQAPFPWLLVALALSVAVLLAAFEAWAPALTWRQTA